MQERGESQTQQPLRVRKYIGNEAETQALYKKLSEELGVYSNERQEHGIVDLQESSRMILYKDCDAYLLASKNPHERREAFIEYVVNLLADENNYVSDRQVLDFKEIFGAKGIELYLAALEEESFDRHYRHAVFNASTTFVPGQTWKTSPAIVIAGPSASGKSHATQRVIQALGSLPPALDTTGTPIMDGNLIACIDGGVIREESQMRKLAIKIAYELGYGGIKDLHDKSKVLENIRTVMNDVLLTESDNFGVLVPETFSHWINPFNNYKKFIESLGENRDLIFTQVLGATDSFQETVKQMGTRRAWKNDDTPVDIDLNSKKGIKESKAYPEMGFYWGNLGSEKALEFYKKLYGDEALTIIIPNDLILLKKVNNEWVEASAGEPGVELVSQALFEEWQEYHNLLGPQDLLTYAEQHPSQLPMEFSACLKLLLRMAPEASVLEVPAANPDLDHADAEGLNPFLGVTVKA
jgi:hypothetical protein